METRKILSGRVLVHPAHDVKDVHGLITRAPSPPLTLLADKGYDREPLHEWLDQRGIRAVVPVRKGCCPGRHRRVLRDRFPNKEYAQRNIVEAVFKSLKTVFGGHVRGRNARTVRAELFMRLIPHSTTSKYDFRE